ncbi:MAG: VacJ family lipoprotein [Chthoniobacteraceae bacterium]|nr:VacJ family lipoprotein [Chthoniobacteraceae bacterium]
MKANTPLLLCVLGLSCAALAQGAEASKALPEGEFHDPFAATDASKPAAEGEFHDPFAATDAASSPAASTERISDPLERLNRGTYYFNDHLYRWVLRPAAKGYGAVAPKPMRESVDRFFVNIKYPVRGVNNLLQGRFSAAGIETARFVVNTTVGVGGLFDPATRWKLKAQPADFDQTLARYRVPTGIYLNWPVLGPSSLRGTVGLAGDSALSPTFYLDSSWRWVTTGATGFNMVNTTSLHFEEYDALKNGTLDPYAALRSAYFENRKAAAAKKE